MAAKNKIKIDSFKIDKMRQSDLKDALKLAVVAQSTFGISDNKAPSQFLKEIGALISENMPYSFVYRDESDKIFAAFIIKPETSISAEFALLLSDPNVIQTKIMYDEFFKIIKELKFKVFFTKVFKKRKKLNLYIKLLNIYGFTEFLDENEEFFTVYLKSS
jgi:hypothetical protein